MVSFDKIYQQPSEWGPMMIIVRVMVMTIFAIILILFYRKVFFGLSTPTALSPLKTQHLTSKQHLIILFVFCSILAPASPWSSWQQSWLFQLWLWSWQLTFLFSVNTRPRPDWQLVLNIAKISSSIWYFEISDWIYSMMICKPHLFFVFMWFVFSR